MMKHSFLFKSIAVSASLSLLGCGGEDAGSTAPPPPLVNTVDSVSDVMTTAEVGVRHRIPVYLYVQPKEGQLLSISSVRSVSDLSSADKCPTPAINGLELVYTPDSQGVCGYEYIITDGNNSTKARIISTASLDDVTKLNDISKPTSVGTALTITIDSPEVNNETLTVVSVLGSGSAYASGNDVIFEATAPGLVRVIYTLSQEVASAPLKVGVINITVNEVGNNNTAPSTPDIMATAAPGQTITISPPITDDDRGDDPQLISVVNSQGATVRSSVQDGLVDENYFTNKNFTFRATTPGAYSVYYTAHDHRGGYNTGKVKVSVTGLVGLMARDASFYRDQTSTPYDFTIDLRSYVTAANPDSVTYLPAEFAVDSADKTSDNIVMSQSNQILTYKVPANQSGTVKINYKVKDNLTQTSGTIFIAFGGGALPTITTMGTTPRLDIGANVEATSTCGTGCVQSMTTYEWLFNGTYYSDKPEILVPEGYSGESLTLIATPYNSTGQRGISKATTYHYPFRMATVSVNKEKAKIGEAITLTVNTTYLGQPDANAPVKVTPISAKNRQNQSQNVTARVNGGASSTLVTNASGNASFTLTDLDGKGVKTRYEATIHNHAYGSEEATFTTLTSPDVSTANFWGHMPNSIIVGDRQFHRTPLASEENGAAGDSFIENGEEWGRFTKAEGNTYCLFNFPSEENLITLYTEHPSGALSRTYGWPVDQSYLSSTSRQVVDLSTGVASSSNDTHPISCSTLLPIDSTGVTIDILKEDGDYTNDKFPLSSSAMTYGALMFPGAGIRINLPDEIDASSIQAKIPSGYQTQVVGKSVILTDMAPTDYRDQIITVTAQNTGGDVVGVKLKVSSAKYQTAEESDYVPSVLLASELQVERGEAFPSEHKLYQHGMVITNRIAQYEEVHGQNPRLVETINRMQNRWTAINLDVSLNAETYVALVAAPEHITSDGMKDLFNKFGGDSILEYAVKYSTIARPQSHWTSGFAIPGDPASHLWGLKIKLKRGAIVAPSSAIISSPGRVCPTVDGYSWSSFTDIGVETVSNTFSWLEKQSIGDSVYTDQPEIYGRLLVFGWENGWFGKAPWFFSPDQASAVVAADTDGRSLRRLNDGRIVSDLLSTSLFSLEVLNNNLALQNQSFWWGWGGSYDTVCEKIEEFLPYTDASSSKTWAGVQVGKIRRQQGSLDVRPVTSTK